MCGYRDGVRPTLGHVDPRGNLEAGSKIRSFLVSDSSKLPSSVG
jgi:hypothetical protein